MLTGRRLLLLRNDIMHKGVALTRACRNLHLSPATSGGITAIASPSAVAQPESEVYVNPICMKMDQLINSASFPEDVLTITVTQRGVLFVHNLLTALRVLADLSEEQIPFSKAKLLKHPEQLEQIERDKLLADPRYDLIIRDLIEYSSKLDLHSIDSVMKSLYRLNHCHYKLFGALLRRVYSIDLESCDISTAVSVGQSFEWAGFGKAETFFKRLALVVSSSVSELSNRDYLHCLALYSKLDQHYPQALSDLIADLPKRLPQMSSTQIGISAIAASEYGSNVGSSQSACLAAADALLLRMQTHTHPVAVRDVIRTVIALRRTTGDHPQFLRSAWELGVSQLSNSLHFKERLHPSVASISDLSQLVSSCAHFGVGSVTDLQSSILPYVLDNFDVTTEESAIRFLQTVSMFPSAVTPATAPTVSLLIRKVASSTDSWEKHKLKLISIAFSKWMNFDFIDTEFRKMVVDQSLAHWLIARRGYGVPYPEVSKPLFEAVDTAGKIEQGGEGAVLFNEWIPNSPYHADVLIPSKRIAILVLSKFSSSGSPVGVDLLQVKHIESLGWEVITVDRRELIQSFSDVGGEVIRKIVAQLRLSDSSL